jgi:hypothetical protein
MAHFFAAPNGTYFRADPMARINPDPAMALHGAQKGMAPASRSHATPAIRWPRRTSDGT